MSTVDNRNILVIVTADDCGACNNFKQNGLSQLIKDIQTSGIVRHIHINKKSMKAVIEAPYPTQLNSLAVWYPTFILINGKAWNNNFSESKNVDLPVEVFNGVYKDGLVKFEQTNRKNLDKLIPWINDHVDNNPKFKVFTATATSIITKTAEEENVPTKKVVYIQTCGSFNIKASSRR